MTDFEDMVSQYWKYYIALEKSFLETERYVELDYVNNANTYSMTYMQLFQSICSEIDVVGKALGMKCETSFKPKKSTGLNEWWYHISQHFVDIQSSSCDFMGTNSITPWNGYVVIKNSGKGKNYILDESSGSHTPDWWIKYNGAKHNRTEKENGKSNYMNANLKNVVDSLAALYILETKLLELIFDKSMDDTLPDKYVSSVFGNDQEFYTCLLAVN